MSDMKCPFCGQEMIEHPFVSNTGVAAYSCCNKDCEIHDKYIIAPIMKMLDRTRNALEIAVDALKSAHDYYEYCIQRDKDYGGDDINWDCTAMNMDNDISEALEQVTALEQKE